jgi:hypothetical protein
MNKDARLSDAKQKLLDMAMRGKLAPVAVATSEIKHYSRENPIPLAPAQEQVWRLDQIAGKLAPLHNESITIYRHGPCDPAVLERSLTEIIRRHEIWRTTFDVIDDSIEARPIQIIHAPTAFTLPISDLRTLTASEREQSAQDLANADAREPFDLQSGPLVRARLITLSDEEHRFYVTAHQSIVDGITVFDIFPRELTTLYESFAQGKPSPLPELDAQFADFACWQRQKLSADAMQSQLAYWQKQLAGELPVLQWPNHGKRPAQQTYRGAMHSFQLPHELAESLKDLGRRDGATLFMVLLAGLVALLHRYTGQEDIIVGTLAPAGRKQTEFQRLMGYFLNPVALRANLSGNPSFHSLIRQMRDVTLGAISNDDVPLEWIAERLRLTPDPSRHSFFTVALSVAPDVPQLPSGWSMT